MSKIETIFITVRSRTWISMSRIDWFLRVLVRRLLLLGTEHSLNGLFGSMQHTRGVYFTAVLILMENIS